MNSLIRIALAVLLSYLLSVGSFISIIFAEEHDTLLTESSETNDEAPENYLMEKIGDDIRIASAVPAATRKVRSIFLIARLRSAGEFDLR